MTEQEVVSELRQLTGTLDRLSAEAAKHDIEFVVSVIATNRETGALIHDLSIKKRLY